MTRKNTVRAKFEAWLRRNWPPTLVPTMRTADGRYSLAPIEAEWQAFRAGAESTRRH